MTCIVCTKTGATWTIHGYTFHPKCAPGYWLEEDQKHMVFMGKVKALANSRSKRWERWR